MKKYYCQLLIVGIVFLCNAIGYGSARTAPEFTLTIDTENFKEIRIPMDLWKKIITRNYNPAGKKPSKKTSLLGKWKNNVDIPETSTLAISNSSEFENAYVIDSTAEEVIEPTVHEVVLHINVPQEADGDALASSSNEITQDTIMATNLGNLEKPALETMPIIDVMVRPAVEDAADVVLSVANSGEAAAGAAGVSPTSVLVQTVRFPCICEKGSCGCCAIMFLQKGCANVQFLPEEFSFEMKMTMNGNLIAKRKVPVSDPPPFCFNPRRAPFLELCAQLNNIHLRKNDIHVCVDIDASVGGFDLFSWTFNCLKFGNQGIVTGLDPETATKGGKPQDSSIFGDFFGGGSDSDSEDDDDEDDDSDEGGLLDGLFGDDDDDY